MLNIKDNDRLILTLKGLEQFYYQKHSLAPHEALVLEIVHREIDADSVIKMLIEHRAPPDTIFELHQKSYITMVPKDEVETEKEKINTLFLQQQSLGTEAQALLGMPLKFDEYDFQRSDSPLKSTVRGLSPGDITLLPGGRERETLYSNNSNPSSGISETRGGSKISTKTPEVKAFEEIKLILGNCIKEVFSIRAYLYTYQLNRVQNRAELNEFFQKVHKQFLRIKGEEYIEELTNKITAINTNYFIKK